MIFALSQKRSQRKGEQEPSVDIPSFCSYCQVTEPGTWDLRCPREVGPDLRENLLHIYEVDNEVKHVQ